MMFMVMVIVNLMILPTRMVMVIVKRIMVMMKLMLVIVKLDDITQGDGYSDSETKRMIMVIMM